MTMYLLELSQGIILLLLTWVGWGVAGVRKELRMLNGRMLTMEQWRQDFVPVAEKQQDAHSEAHADMWQANVRQDERIASAEQRLARLEG